MNIFYLDEDVEKCAIYHCDKHVIKMILETTQILCTVVNLQGVVTPYKSTHVNHPCVLWAKKSYENWSWLQSLGFCLYQEYQYRYGANKKHKSFDVMKNLSCQGLLPSLGITTRPQAMNECYQIPNNPVQAYRQYYLHEKSRLLSYTKRELPYWVKESSQNDI